ncbi:MAG: 16S rRNA (uracil(1498)-N(3))-methyltransferase [Gammaproteobacteria bacterium]|nr:16S rRNA (uracil(1498)-N(3))-methyltransferase [Gammaproteobacteria bacterium]
MRIPRIFTTQTLETSTQITLEAKAVKHIKDVLRMSIGNQIILFNGNGNDYHSTISELSKKHVGVTIDSKFIINNESSLLIHLLQPLCRSEKMDWCLQKATELGVGKITPFISSRVNINITDKRLEKKMDHWHSVIQSACEQSGRASLPIIYEPIDFDIAINNSHQEDIKLIASPMANENIFSSTQARVNTCICAIGPEGGFDKNEITQAQKEGFTPIQMGPRILRLETAVISALTLCQSRWGDFN